MSSGKVLSSQENRSALRSEWLKPKLTFQCRERRPEIDSIEELIATQNQSLECKA